MLDVYGILQLTFLGWKSLIGKLVLLMTFQYLFTVSWIGSSPFIRGKFGHVLWRQIILNPDLDHTVVNSIYWLIDFFIVYWWPSWPKWPKGNIISKSLYYIFRVILQGFIWSSYPHTMFNNVFAHKFFHLLNYFCISVRCMQKNKHRLNFQHLDARILIKC